MTRGERAVQRALSAIGRPTIYGLGAGTLYAKAPHPADEEGECDCSAFVCWALEIDKFDPQEPGPKDDIWYNTDRIWVEALEGGPRFTLVAAAEARPGDLLVYPSMSTVRHYRPRMTAVHRLPKIGHVAMVVSTDGGTVVETVDCSSSNYRRPAGDAIQRTLTPSVFRLHPATLTARFIPEEE